MPSRKKSRRRSPRRRSPRRKSPRRRSPARRSLRFNPKLSINLSKMVINERRVDTIENSIDEILKSNTRRVPRDVSNIIGEYDNYDDEPSSARVEVAKVEQHSYTTDYRVPYYAEDDDW